MKRQETKELVIRIGKTQNSKRIIIDVWVGRGLREWNVKL